MRFSSQTIRSFLLAFLFCIGGAVIAQADDAPTCESCHENSSMDGIHGGSMFGPFNAAAGCTDCHGSLLAELPEHELDGRGVISFLDDRTPTPTQNMQCLNCHEPEQMSLAHWSHDAHGNDVACVACHDLHSDFDPVMGLSYKATVDLCVACHQDPVPSALGESQ